MIAVIPVREGRLAHGADAAVAEASGRVLLVGERTADAAATLRTVVSELYVCEAGGFRPGAWARGLADALSGEAAVVLPGSPDGRDLAGRLAGALDRPCHAWCEAVRATEVVMTRHDGAATAVIPVTGAFVATLVPRPTPHATGTALPAPTAIALGECDVPDAYVLELLDADPAAVDLAEADRIVAGGVGLGGPEQFEVLARVAALLRASVGATRPVADRGIVEHARQIGTTGVSVDPTLYVAFGISGAVQHTAGLGQPARVIAVNTDPACPMMAMADLAVIADAAATARSLAALLAEGAR